MLRQATICSALFFLAVPFALATQNKMLNLSVTLPEQIQDQAINRAKRVQVLEQFDPSAKSLDELDQDRLFIRRYRDFQEQLPFEAPPISAEKTGKSILFFDLNFAPSEIKAARAAAQARGEDFYVFPERTQAQQDEIEKEYRILVALNDKLKTCDAASGGCDNLEKDFLAVQGQVNRLIAQIKRVDSNDLDGIFTQLETQGVKVSVMVLSGHSGGGLSEVLGLFGNLAPTDLKAATEMHPKLFTNLNSILLWGCYTGTLHNLNKAWQERFPSVQAFMGYRNRAPLGIRDSSGILLKGYLMNEEKFLSAKSLKASHQVFRKIPMTAELDAGAAKGDAYFTYDQAGKISDMMKICDNFDKTLLDKYECYNNAEPGCENPPADHQGPLRELYTFVQVNRHCTEAISAEGLHFPSPDMLIRLIFSDEVKKNFTSHHKNEFQSFADYADEAGHSKTIRLEAFENSTRAQDMKWLATLNADQRGNGMRDGTVLGTTKWLSPMLIDVVQFGVQLMLSKFEMAEPCIPLSWIEPQAKDADHCEISDYLLRPLSSRAAETLTRRYYIAQIGFWFADHDPSLRFEIPRGMPWTQFKERRRSSAQYRKEILEKMADRTPTEDRRLKLYGEIIDQMDTLTDDEIRNLALATMDEAILFIDQKIQEVQGLPRAEVALDALQLIKQVSVDSRKAIQDLQ